MGLEAGMNERVVIVAVGRPAPARPMRARPSCIGSIPSSEDPRSDHPTSTSANSGKAPSARPPSCRLARGAGIVWCRWEPRPSAGSTDADCCGEREQRTRAVRHARALHGTAGERRMLRWDTSKGEYLVDEQPRKDGDQDMSCIPPPSVDVMERAVMVGISDDARREGLRNGTVVDRNRLRSGGGK